MNQPQPSQTFENTPNRVLDRYSEKGVELQPMKQRNQKPTKDAKITFVASPADQEIIAAGIKKYGIRKMSEIIRMALRRFAETEGLNTA